MIIECGRCDDRAVSCDGCMVSALRDTPDGIGDLTAAELRAVGVFETAGFDVQLLRTPPPAPVAPPVPVVAGPVVAVRRPSRQRHVA